MHQGASGEYTHPIGNLTNTFYNSDKYILRFGQLQLICNFIWNVYVHCREEGCIGFMCLLFVKKYSFATLVEVAAD